MIITELTNEENKKPNFLVTAVPRSGTTLLARVLNEHPRLLCGMERFKGPTLSPAHLTFEGFKTLDLEKAAVSRHHDLIKQKMHLSGVAIGEKCPRAYLHFEEIMPHFKGANPPLRIISIFRSIEDVEHSWYRRASNKDDLGWAPGQYGVVPYIEMVILVWQLTKLQNPDRCLLLSYDHLVSSTKQNTVLEVLADHLTIKGTQEILSAMKSERHKTDKSLNRERLSHDFTFSTNASFFHDVVDIINTHGACNLKELQSDLTTSLTSLLQNKTFFKEVLTYVTEVQDPDIRAYHKRMAKTYYNALKTLDADFATSLETAMQKPLRSNTLDSSGGLLQQISSPPLQPYTRHYDFSNLVDFYIKFGILTGIQRVQIEAIRAVASQDANETQFAIYFDQDIGWKSLPLQDFANLFVETPDLNKKLLGFKEAVTGLDTPNFHKGDIIYFIGATWDNPGLFSALSPLRANGVKCIFYIHDLLPIQYPEFFELGHSMTVTHWLNECLHNADGIVCNSEETKAALLTETFYRGPISVADLNIYPRFIADSPNNNHIDEDDWFNKLCIGDSEFVLMVGTIEPRKNHLTAIHVWQSLIRAHGTACPKLLIVGKAGWMAYPKAVTHILETEGDRIHSIHLDKVSDKQLAQLYHRCLFSIYISRCEGWGLPVTEALASGGVCIVGKNSAAAAAKQNLVVPVDERSESNIVEVISHLLEDRKQLSEIRDKVKQEARFKSWQEFVHDLGCIEAQLDSQTITLEIWPTLTAGETYHFGKRQVIDLKKPESSGLELLNGNGWNMSDSWGSWTRKFEAELCFHLPTTEPYFFYGVVTLSDHHSSTHFLMRSEGAPLWEGNLQPNQRKLIHGVIAPTEGDSPTTLTLQSSKVLDCSTVDNHADIRTLGVGLIEMCLVPANDMKQRLSVIEDLMARYIDN